MLALTTKDVRMNAKANTKEEALQLLADILHEDGLTHGDYLQGLKNREAKAPTYLGQGVAIPHGTPDSRSLIYNTGVRLVHFSNGVIWNDAGDKVYLAAVIAAKSDEHLDILKLLTRTLSDNVEDKIKNAQTADELIAIINGVPDSLLLHENLIKTDVAAGDLDELSYQACALLKSGGILDSVLTIKPVLTKLSQAIYALILEDDNIHQSALSLVVAKKPVMYQKDKVKALAVIASNAHMDTARLSKVYDVLLSHDFNHALNQSAKQIARLLHAEEAVGLLRTELVFMAHHNMPDVQTQILDYQKVFNDLEDRPLVVRTLDVGGDKPLPYLPMPAEENPFLGVRGIRLTLEQPKLLKDQLTALIVASKGRDLRIMFPMIGRIEEWRAAKAILDDVLQEYPHDNLQAGIMMEVPSAAIMAEDFAKEVDFFSVGTNDLTQYTLAIDRGHPTLSKDADGLHPSILRLIDKTVQAAHAYGKWVGVCGELASDEKAVPILLGLGVDELSMSSTSIALTKAQIRELNLQECQTLAKKALSCTTSQEVRALIRDE